MNAAKYVLVAAAVCLLLPMAAMAAQELPSDEDVRVYIIGPKVVGVGQNISYSVVVTGGPGEDGGEFSYESEVSGVNLTSNSLVPSSDSSDGSGFFTANLLVPDETQTLKIYVKGISAKDADKSTGEATIEVEVIKPTLLTATIRNDGDVEVKSVDVRFYVDGALLETTTLTSLKVDEVKIVTANWTVKNPSDGKHVAKVEVDTEGTGVILVESGSTEYYRTFYVNAEEPKWPWYAAFAVLAVALGASAYLLRKSGYL